MLCPSLTWKPPRTTCYRSTLHQQPWPRAKVVFGLQREYSHHPTPPTAALALHPLPTAHNLDTTTLITNMFTPLPLLVTHRTPLHVTNTTLNNIKTIGNAQLPRCLVRVWTPSSSRPRVHNAPLTRLAIIRRAKKTVQLQVTVAPVDLTSRGIGVGKRSSSSKPRNQSLIEGSREGKLVLPLPNGNRCLQRVVAPPPQALGVARGDERRSSQKHVTGVLIHIDLLDCFFQYTFPPTTIILALTLTCDLCVNVSLS